MSRILTEGFEYGIPAYGYWSGTSYRGTEWQYVAYTEASNRASSNSGLTSSSRTGNFALMFGLIHQYNGGNYYVHSSAIREFEESSEIYCRVYFKPNLFPPYLANIIRILDGANGQLLNFRLASDGRIEVLNHSGGSIGKLPPIPTNEWLKMEFHISVATSGLIEVWLNDSLTTSYSGDTKGTKGNASKLQIGTSNANVAAVSLTFTMTFDDIAINNTLGTINNGRCGGGGVVGVKPTGAGSYTQFTPIGGTDNWANLTDAPTTADTNYNHSATPGNIDTFIFEKLADKGFANLDLINSVSVEMYSKYYSEPANWAAYFKGVSEHELGNVSSPVDYNLKSFITDIDPDTGNKFTVGKIDSMEFGYKHKGV